MPGFPLKSCLPAALIVLAPLFAAPASAQTMADLDYLSDISANEETGIDAARAQADSGTYLEALATLERVMAAHPRSLGARLLHAVYLCRIDDRQGGLVEIDNMDEDDFGEQNIADAREQCSRPYIEPEPLAPAPSSAGAVSESPAPSSSENGISGANSVSGGNSISGSNSTSSRNAPPSGTDGGEKD